MGSSSATWVFPDAQKDLIATQPSPPRTVIILFRSRQLTLPAHRTQGEYRRSMELYMRDSEPLVEKLAGPVRVPTGTLDRLVQAVYPMERRRVMAQEKVQAWALDFVASSREYAEIHNDAKALFGPRNSADCVQCRRTNKRMGDRPTSIPTITSLTPWWMGPFLPHLLQIAGEKGIHLVFFGVKRRPYADWTPRGRGKVRLRTEYTRALGAYLEKQGARLYDETHDRDVTLDFYGSGDHVKDEMIPRYTEIFWGKIAKLVHPEAAR